MEDNKQIANMTDEELILLFNQANSIEERVKIFSKIQNEDRKMELLFLIPEQERYKFIGRLKTPQAIAVALNSLDDDKIKSKTFNFIAKQFKGNNEGLLKILTQIDFDVTIPTNMLTFQLNNINALNLDFLINIQKHSINHSAMKFKINEDDDSRNIEYSFSEISAIIAKIEELTVDIPTDMDEANKFYKIYSRITKMMTYDHLCIVKQDQAKYNRFHTNDSWQEAQIKYEERMEKIRKNPAGLYGGLVDGKAICAGYALILHEALKYTGLKSLYVTGCQLGVSGHAWNQVQIDGKWYNCDSTWDSETYRFTKTYKYMLLNDEDFNKSHGKFSAFRTKTEHKCKSKFDYSKIQGLSLSQIQTGERIGGYSL